LETFLVENEIPLNMALMENIKEHCIQLILEFKKYFPQDLSAEFWIAVEAELLPDSLTLREKEELIELSCDSSLSQELEKMVLAEFWIARRTEYPLIAEKAVKFLLPFSTTYLCKSGFSSASFFLSTFAQTMKAFIGRRIRCSLADCFPPTDILPGGGN